MDLVEDFTEPGVSMVAACASLGVSRATLYRGTCPWLPPKITERTPSPRRLGDNERQAIIDVMHSAEFVDQPPMEVFAKLLSRGVYLASIRTFYRVLTELGESKERRNQRLPHPHVKPSLTATAPNQVWTWDITKLATLQKGVFLHAYVIIDLFSRFVVGWMVASKECKHLATQLFAESVARHGIEPGLTVHSDRGSAMKSDTLAQLFGTPLACVSRADGRERRVAAVRCDRVRRVSRLRAARGGLPLARVSQLWVLAARCIQLQTSRVLSRLRRSAHG
jgi:hypothetical protein